MNRLLVIIVTYNAMPWAGRCFGSLQESTVPSDVFVVDNGSTDGTVDFIRDAYPEFILHCSKENLGFGRANNIGMKYAVEKGYDYIYLLNQDAWVMPDTFSRLINAMESNPGFGVLSPMQMTSSMMEPDHRFKVKCLDHTWSDYQQDVVYEVSFVMAAHWLISKECLNKVGGFSPAFRHYGEDDNWLHRASYHGYRIGFLGGVCAVHDRESRKMSKAAAMRLKCVASIVKVSNPLSCLPLRLLFQPFELLCISLLRMSFDVLRFIPGFIRSYPELIRIRRQSETEHPFL